MTTQGRIVEKFRLLTASTSLIGALFTFLLMVFGGWSAVESTTIYVIFLNVNF